MTETRRNINEVYMDLTENQVDLLQPLLFSILSRGLERGVLITKSERQRGGGVLIRDGGLIERGI